jgi:exosortase A
MNAVMQPCPETGSEAQAVNHAVEPPVGLPASGGASAWRLLLAVLVPLLLGLLLLYRETALGMVQIWARSDTFMHAFLVPPITLWLLWRERARLAATAPAPTLALLPALALAGLLWFVGELASSNALSQFALVALVVLGVAAFAGRRAARLMLFPLGFLFFSVPVGEFLLPLLMTATADFTVAALRLSGIPVYRDGLLFMIPTGNWSVIEACSGVRYLIASTMVGALFAYINYRSMRRRLVFFAVALAVPLVANWVRAYMVVMIGHLSNNKLAVGVDHLLYGWVFFGVVMALMFMWGARWSDLPAAAKTVVPIEPSPALSARPPRGRLAMVATGFVLCAALPALALHALAGGTNPMVALLQPPSITHWTSVSPPRVAWSPQFQSPAAEWQQTFERQGREVTAYIAYYRQQDKRRKLISSDNVLVHSEDNTWRLLLWSERTVDLGVLGSTSVRTAKLRGAALPGQDAALAVWQLYWVDGHFTGSGLQARLLGLWQRLRGRGDDGAAIVLSTAELQPGEGEVALQTFLQDNAAAIATELQRAHDGR